MRPTLAEIDSAILEAEQVRASHDGVHTIHSCVMVLLLCRTFAENGDWSDSNTEDFHGTVTKVRCINRTGFPPRAYPNGRIVVLV